MNIISRINDLLTFFQPLFNSQEYALFCAFIMDRGSKNRKVFKALLSLGHNILCRAKSKL